jgi:hypothetical protein
VYDVKHLHPDRLVAPFGPNPGPFTETQLARPLGWWGTMPASEAGDDDVVLVEVEVLA